MKKNLFVIPVTEFFELEFKRDLLTGSPTFNSVNGTEEVNDGGDEDF